MNNSLRIGKTVVEYTIKNEGFYNHIVEIYCGLIFCNGYHQVFTISIADILDGKPSANSKKWFEYVNAISWLFLMNLERNSIIQVHSDHNLHSEIESLQR